MMELIHGAECQVAEIDGVRLAVTKMGGHLTADFRLGDRVVSPYALAPWQPDEVGSDLPVLLSHLRGDFLCLPVGPQDDGPPHGEVANGEWRSEEEETQGVHLVMRTGDTKASVKKISLREGHRALYIEHEISELVGEWSYGNHPIQGVAGVSEEFDLVSMSQLVGVAFPSARPLAPGPRNCGQSPSGALASSSCDSPELDRLKPMAVIGRGCGGSPILPLLLSNGGEESSGS